MKAICVGHCTFDTTLPVDNYPVENNKYRIEKRVECGGGPASNAAYLLAKWGMDTSIAAIIGNDYYGKKIYEEFREVGANLNYLELRDGFDTSSSYIIANMSNGSRTIITSKRKPVRRLNATIGENFDVILVDGEHPETAIDVLKSNPNAISVLDAGRLNDDTRLIGKLVTYVVCSHDFAEEFTSCKIDSKDMDLLIDIYTQLKNYFNTNIIITLEGNGSFTFIDGEYKIVPSIHVDAIDSTGAGDIFHGAFTYFIANGYSLEDSIRYASICGAISVTRIGSRFSIPDFEEVINYDNVI